MIYQDGVQGNLNFDNCRRMLTYRLLSLLIHIAGFAVAYETRVHHVHAMNIMNYYKRLDR